MIIPLFVIWVLVTDVCADVPRLDTADVNVTVIQGKTAILPCTVDNSGDHYILWTKQSSTVSIVLTRNEYHYIDDPRIRVVRPFTNDWNLQILYVGYADQGQYECRVSSSTGQTLWKRVHLIVLDVMTSDTILDTSDINITAITGTDTVLPCEVENLARYKVVWVDRWSTILTYMERRIIDDDRISVERPYAEDWNLHIRNVQLRDQGQYWCRINTRPIQEKRVILTVRDVMTSDTILDTSDINITAITGTIAILPCEVENLARYKIVWADQWSTLLTYMDKRIIDDDRISIERPYVEDWNLHIRNVQLRDQGQYWCKINTRPIQEKRVILTVRVQPEIYLRNDRIGQYLGRDTILECRIFAIPMEIMYWRRNGSIIANSRKYRIDLYREDEQNAILSLFIADLTADDFGVYTCYTENEFGAAEKDIHLYRIFPSLINLIGTEYVHMYQKINLTCTVTGVDRAPEDIDWFHKGNKIHTGDPRWQNRIEITKYKPEIPGRSLISNLIIERIKLDDAGSYVCRSSDFETTSIKIHVLNETPEGL